MAKFYCFAFRSIGSEGIFHPSACKSSRQDANIRRLHRCDVWKWISNGNCDSSLGSTWHDIIILFWDETSFVGGCDEPSIDNIIILLYIRHSDVTMGFCVWDISKLKISHFMKYFFEIMRKIVFFFQNYFVVDY